MVENSSEISNIKWLNQRLLVANKNYYKKPCEKDLLYYSKKRSTRFKINF